MWHTRIPIHQTDREVLRQISFSQKTPDSAALDETKPVVLEISEFENRQKVATEVNLGIFEPSENEIQRIKPKFQLLDVVLHVRNCRQRP